MTNSLRAASPSFRVDRFLLDLWCFRPHAGESVPTAPKGQSLPGTSQAQGPHDRGTSEALATEGEATW